MVRNSSATGHCRKTSSGLGRTGEKHPVLHAYKSNESLDIPSSGCVIGILPITCYAALRKLGEIGGNEAGFVILISFMSSNHLSGFGSTLWALNNLKRNNP